MTVANKKQQRNSLNTISVFRCCIAVVNFDDIGACGGHKSKKHRTRSSDQTRLRDGKHALSDARNGMSMPFRAPQRTSDFPHSPSAEQMPSRGTREPLHNWCLH